MNQHLVLPFCSPTANSTGLSMRTSWNEAIKTCLISRDINDVMILWLRASVCDANQMDGIYKA